MNQKTNMKHNRPVHSTKRTPRTVILEEKTLKNKPPVLSETFNLKNFDLIGKIDDMRILTKELSVMARQLEQWISIAHTVSMAFKDNSVLKDMLKAITSVNTGGHQDEHRNERENQPFSLPFSFMQNEGRPNQREDNGMNGPGFQNNSNSNINLMEILNNPAFKEIMSKLFTTK